MCLITHNFEIVIEIVRVTVVDGEIDGLGIVCGSRISAHPESHRTIPIDCDPKFRRDIEPFPKVDAPVTASEAPLPQTAERDKG
jgi:hypothetical protein